MKSIRTIAVAATVLALGACSSTYCAPESGSYSYERTAGGIKGADGKCTYTKTNQADRVFASGVNK
jgi:hypothetical protein